MDPTLIADLSTMRKIQHATLSERVYQDLCELIQAGQVRPGQKLTLKGLADALGTSPMPVREAVRQLAAEGALEILPNRAMRVPLMTKGKFRELLKIRLALEGLAIEHAARHIDAVGLEQVARLHDTLSVEMKRKRPNVDLVIRLNKQLHFAAYQGSGMPTLVDLIAGLWLQVGPVINLDLRAGSRRLAEAPALVHHARLLEGLRAGSPEKARAGLEGDLLSAAEMILAGDGLPD
ncbi:GntR family transcriptional regulator [Herbaspirillum seropedicae]|uniref:Transcription regulator protein n=1 Tax=Herbaspirillum seropedicae (strain SmR1) TaxID=757424 RepID=D8IPM4_HERSS|nr:GntR family transcriptional regulator [Herbaspirillum seropedicae]ADJ64921.1 transcription regulator protein [Herbaspirillum seropedicae SmR1]AKN66814.1 transcriptional regulator [Herbaspirillum seropedicae]NQE28169.1 transcriptional regulator [Herbaspirillum seropedicae]UMU22806.1 GntR family transcriptional regulator [Herbaspirillum seropedicae]